MSSVKVKATIVEDNSGVKSQIPILLTEQGEVGSVTDYVLKLEAEGSSHSSMNAFIRAVSLLLEYMEANKGLFGDPEKLFQTFAKRLYTGTIGEDGLDPSGLYWIPSSTTTNNIHIQQLTAFTSWLSNKHGTAVMNPLRAATKHEQRLNYAAWHRKTHNDFLGHIEDKTINNAVRRARTLKGRVPLIKTEDDAVSFPNKHWDDFFKYGMGGAKDPRVALRDKLILLLMHGGSLRESEAVLPWVTDVFEDPDNPENAIVRIYHEIEGKAPNNWKSRGKVKTRKAYLSEEYGRIPRKLMRGTQHLGSKGKVVDHSDQYMQVHWFPADYGKVFMALWKDYQKYRASIDCHHPYAFISYEKTALGNPYTLTAFNKNYEAGLKRIDLEPSKENGLSPQGHRHNYGRRIERAGLSPMIIKRAMHHKSLESQIPYTHKALGEVSDALTQASLQLASPQSKQALDWKDLVEYGFEDIDPEGYFTGKNPRLGRK